MSGKAHSLDAHIPVHEQHDLVSAAGPEGSETPAAVVGARQRAYTACLAELQRAGTQTGHQIMPQQPASRNGYLNGEQLSHMYMLQQLSVACIHAYMVGSTAGAILTSQLVSNKETSVSP